MALVAAAILALLAGVAVSEEGGKLASVQAGAEAYQACSIAPRTADAPAADAEAYQTEDEDQAVRLTVDDAARHAARAAELDHRWAGLAQAFSALSGLWHYVTTVVDKDPFDYLGRRSMTESQRITYSRMSVAYARAIQTVVTDCRGRGSIP
ncbi:MAG: hypothetical protein JO147_12830 [Actinobacteria bacterium]|nr:hypothetical protein [Actinomycetota bacterium]